MLHTVVNIEYMDVVFLPACVLSTLGSKLIPLASPDDRLSSVEMKWRELRP